MIVSGHYQKEKEKLEVGFHPAFAFQLERVQCTFEEFEESEHQLGGEI